MWPTRIRHGPWDILGAVVDVEFLIDGCRDGLDLGPQLLLDLVQIEPVIPVDEIDSETQMSKTSGTSYSM